MLHRLMRSGALAAAGLAMTATFATPAHAGAEDLLAASLTHTIDVESAALENFAQVQGDPNTTCQVTTTGTAVVQRTNALVGEIYGQDMGTAVGECFSFDTSRYSATVVVHVEAFYASGLVGGTWVTVCSASSSAPSIAGFAQPVPPVALCSYAGMNPHLNRYHRAHGILTNTRGQVYHSYSPIWFMTP